VSDYQDSFWVADILLGAWYSQHRHVSTLTIANWFTGNSIRADRFLKDWFPVDLKAMGHSPEGVARSSEEIGSQLVKTLRRLDRLVIRPGFGFRPPLPPGDRPGGMDFDRAALMPHQKRLPCFRLSEDNLDPARLRVVVLTILLFIRENTGADNFCDPRRLVFYELDGFDSFSNVWSQETSEVIGGLVEEGLVEEEPERPSRPDFQIRLTRRGHELCRNEIERLLRKSERFAERLPEIERDLAQSLADIHDREAAKGMIGRRAVACAKAFENHCKEMQAVVDEWEDHLLQGTNAVAGTPASPNREVTELRDHLLSISVLLEKLIADTDKDHKDLSSMLEPIWEHEMMKRMEPRERKLLVEALKFLARVSGD